MVEAEPSTSKHESVLIYRFALEQLILGKLAMLVLSLNVASLFQTEPDGSKVAAALGAGLHL